MEYETVWACFVGCNGTVQMATVEKRRQVDASHPATIVFASLITPYKCIPSLVTEFPSVYWLLFLCCFVFLFFFTDSFCATETFLNQQIMQSDRTLSIKAEGNVWAIVQTALKNKSVLKKKIHSLSRLSVQAVSPAVPFLSVTPGYVYSAAAWIGSPLIRVGRDGFCLQKPTDISG